MGELVLGQRPDGGAQHLAVKPVLAGEMVIDGRLVDPRLGDDGANAGRVIAALGEQTLGRFEDALTGDFGRPGHCRPFSNLRLNSK